MTENKLIIDGVDVSKCEHLYRGIDCLAHIDFSECCEGYNPSYGYCPNTDCYYKQLARKEQECEELKEDIERWKSNFNGKVSAIEELLQQLDQFKVKNIKNSKTLTEIKEIAEIEIECKTYEIENDCFNETRCKALNEHIDFIKQILQKISECEGNNE